jgi:hypothetical protein
MHGRWRDVATALAQWRNVDLNRVETKQEISAETTGIDFAIEISVAGRL